MLLSTEIALLYVNFYNFYAGLKILNEKTTKLLLQCYYKGLTWGNTYTYGISDHLNQHPRQAMKLRGDKKNKNNC